MFSIQEIDAHTLSGEGIERYRLIDIRSPMEVAQGKIPGSEHIQMNELPSVIQDLAGPEPVVLYCRSGARSAQACMYLNSQGLDNIINLRGGIIAWAQSGYDVAV
jgi:rhodanese-related sulfurtransferase